MAERHCPRCQPHCSTNFGPVYSFVLNLTLNLGRIPCNQDPELSLSTSDSNFSLTPSCQIIPTQRQQTKLLRPAPGGAFLRGFPSVPECCAGLRRCTDRAPIFRSVCVAVGGICRLFPLWFLVPLLMQSRVLGGARPPITYRACVAARISK